MRPAWLSERSRYAAPSLMSRIFKSPAEIIRLAEHYVGSVSEPVPNAFQAWVQLGQVVRSLHPEQAFDLASHIVHKLPDAYLGSSGGGVLAHLVRHHGHAVVDWVEGEARRDVRFLEALSSMCLATEELNPFVIPRLQAATGTRIQVFTAAQRDATYRGIFNRGITSRRRRRARRSRKPSDLGPLALVRDDDVVEGRD